MPAGAAKYIIAGVDDDLQVRESIEGLIESYGFVPRLFSSAEGFLQSPTLMEANCLITDVRMRGMDGLELQRRVRRVRPELPVIFISAHVDEEVRRRAISGGALEFMYKPFDAAVLLRVIERALNDCPDY